MSQNRFCEPAILEVGTSTIQYFPTDNNNVRYNQINSVLEMKHIFIYIWWRSDQKLKSSLLLQYVPTQHTLRTSKDGIISEQIQ